MKSYWAVVRRVIENANMLILVIDARLPYDTINKELIARIKAVSKPLIYAITKSDLVAGASSRIKIKLEPSVFVSARTGEGIEELIKLIDSKAKESKIDGLIKVGVLGYPNVGKSSLINALKGKAVARTSALSGYTKFTQKIRSGRRMLIIDTPGVLPDDRKNFMKAAMIGSLDFTHVKEPDTVVIGMMQKFPGRIEAFYGVETGEDLEEAIDNIALKKKIFKKGGVIDRERMARLILADWHKGHIII